MLIEPEEALASSVNLLKVCSMKCTIYTTSGHMELFKEHANMTPEVCHIDVIVMPFVN